jgi:hypothetical protein
MTAELSHTALHSLGQAIAAALGTAWTLTPLPEGCRWVELRHTEGYGFHLHNSWPRGRPTITGVWPHSATGESFAPWGRPAKITVTPHKTGRQIAHDITRRFLPAYLPQWREQSARRDQREAYEQQTHAVGRRLALQVGADYHEDRRCLYFHHGTITVSGDEVTFNIRSVTAPQAQRILAILVAPSVPIVLPDTATAHLTETGIGA